MAHGLTAFTLAHKAYRINFWWGDAGGIHA